MPCKNKNCERNCKGERELIQATINQLRKLAICAVPQEVLATIGAEKSCIGCACNQIAKWLEDYFYRKHNNLNDRL